MDADLQHPPHLLARMLELLEEGADQVVARRNRTGDSWTRTALSRGFYKVMNAMVEVARRRRRRRLPPARPARGPRACSSLGERNRFSKGLFAWIGFRTAVVDYDERRAQWPGAAAGGSAHW